MAVAVVSVPVADQDRALDFYRDVIGLALLTDQAIGPAMRWIQLQPYDGGATIALVTWFDGMKPGGVQGLLLAVGDVDAEHARIAALGVAVTDLDQQPWGRFFTLKDPDGNGLIVSALTAPDDIRTR